MTSENPIDNEQPRPNANGEPNKQSSRPEPEVHCATAQSQSTPSPRDCEITSNTKRDWIDKGKLVLELLGLGVVVIYTIFTIKIWRANKDAAEAATTAAQAATVATHTAQTQLELTERPWLTVSLTVDPPGVVFPKEGGLQMNIRPHIKNIGHSVASSVIFSYDMFLAYDNNGIFKQPLERQQKLCESVASNQLAWPTELRAWAKR